MSARSLMDSSTKPSLFAYLGTFLAHSQLRERYWNHCLRYDSVSTEWKNYFRGQLDFERGFIAQVRWLQQRQTMHGIKQSNGNEALLWQDTASLVAHASVMRTRTLQSLMKNAPPELLPTWLTMRMKRMTSFASLIADSMAYDTTT